MPKVRFPKGFTNFEPNLTYKLPINPQKQKTPLRALNHGIGGRIVGGTDAQKGEFPWQISYQIDFGFLFFHSCGGSILNSNKIVTAAHCCDGIGVSDARYNWFIKLNYIKPSFHQLYQIKLNLANHDQIRQMSNVNS